MLFYGLALLVVSAGLLAAISARWATWLLHPPRQPGRRTPGDVGLRYEEVTLCTGDGLRLGAWWIAAPAQGAAPAAPVMILLHPMLGNREGAAAGSPGLPATWAHGLDLLALACRLHAAGYACLLVDFRNHGASDPGLTTGGYTEDRDVSAAVHYAFARLGAEAPGQPPRVGIVGFGLGAAAALTAIGREPGDATTLRVFSADTEGSAGLIAFEPAEIKRLCFVAAVDLVTARTVLRRRLRGTARLSEPLVARLYAQRSGYPLDGSLLPRYARHVHTPVLLVDTAARPANADATTLLAALPGPKQRQVIPLEAATAEAAAGWLCSHIVTFALDPCGMATEHGCGSAPGGDR